MKVMFNVTSVVVGLAGEVVTGTVTATDPASIEGSGTLIVIDRVLGFFKPGDKYEFVLTEQAAPAQAKV